MARISVKGLAQARKKLDALPRDIRAELTSNVRELMAPVAEDLADYPPVRPGQSYERTGILGEGWTIDSVPVVESRPEQVLISLTNAVRYAGDVQETGQQEPYFEEFWAGHTTEDAAERQEPVVQRLAESLATNVTRRF